MSSKMENPGPVIRVNLGVVTIDPKQADIRTLIPFCVKGSPTQCLVNTVARQELGGVRVSTHLKYDPEGRVIGAHVSLTYGNYRFTRPLNASEIRFAQAFDFNKIPRHVLRVSFDLTDPIWSAEPKEVGGGRTGGADGKGTGTPGKKSIRAKSLAMWQMQRKALQEGTPA